MAFELTTRALREAQRSSIEPELVLEIDGVTTLFGAVQIKQKIKFGDPGLKYGDFQWGGLSVIADQESNLQLDRSTPVLNQQLQQDKGGVSSVGSIDLRFQDKNLVMTELMSPGEVVVDILGRRARLYVGFKETAWPDDYIQAFIGRIDGINSGAGWVTLSISHPDQKKRQDVFNQVQAVLAEPIGASAKISTVTTVADGSSSLSEQYFNLTRPLNTYYVYVDVDRGSGYL